MDFLPKTAHLQGGDTRKTPNLANHGIRQEGKGPPHDNPSQSTKSRQPLSILSNTNTHRGKIPIPHLNISVARHTLQAQLLTFLFRKLHVPCGSRPLRGLPSVMQYPFQVTVLEFCAFFRCCITYVCPVQTKRFRHWHRPPMP